MWREPLEIFLFLMAWFVPLFLFIAGCGLLIYYFGG